jgi:sugar (pentulose or hexulose) kinase
MPDLFQDPERAYAVVNLSLALQTVTALERIGLKNGVKVYTEGGFRNNQDYNALLAALCPAAEFYLSGMAEATSFGTALLGWAAVLDKPVKDLANRFAIQKEPVTPAEIPGLDRYAASFFSRLS